MKIAILAISLMVSVVMCETSRAQAPPPSISYIKDTAKTGCLYLVNPMTFETKTCYLQRVVYSTLEFQKPKDVPPSSDSVVLRKEKVGKFAEYYLIQKDKQGKDQWVKVQVISDFNVDFTLK